MLGAQLLVVNAALAKLSSDDSKGRTEPSSAVWMAAPVSKLPFRPGGSQLQPCVDDFQRRRKSDVGLARR